MPDQTNVWLRVLIEPGNKKINYPKLLTRMKVNYEPHYEVRI